MAERPTRARSPRAPGPICVMTSPTCSGPGNAKTRSELYHRGNPPRGSRSRDERSRDHRFPRSTRRVRPAPIAQFAKGGPAAAVEVLIAELRQAGDFNSLLDLAAHEGSGWNSACRRSRPVLLLICRRTRTNRTGDPRSRTARRRAVPREGRLSKAWASSTLGEPDPVREMLEQFSVQPDDDIYLIIEYRLAGGASQEGFRSHPRPRLLRDPRQQCPDLNVNHAAGCAEPPAERLSTASASCRRMQQAHQQRRSRTSAGRLEASV